MNRKFLIALISIFILSFLAAQSDFNIYYKVNLNYSYGHITVLSSDIEFSQNIINNPLGLYKARVVGIKNETLNLTFFDVPNEVLWDSINPNTGKIEGGGFEILNQTEFSIFVPYYENAKEIVIYNKNLSEIARKDISEFSRQETQKINESAAAESGKVAGNLKNQKLLGKISDYWWIFLIIFLILASILFYLLRKGK